jgi:hypothetical protein
MVSWTMFVMDWVWMVFRGGLAVVMFWEKVEWGFVDSLVDLMVRV